MEIEVSTKRRSPNLHFESTKKIINKKITSLVSAVLEKSDQNKRRSGSHLGSSQKKRTNRYE